MNAAQVLDDEVPAAYRRLVQPHVESFNYFLREGLSSVVEGVRPVEIRHPVTQKIHSFWFGNPIIGQPIKTEATVGKEQRLFPRECRQSKKSYVAALNVDFMYGVQGAEPRRLHICLGQLPVMVGSTACNLRGMSKSQLVRLQEEANDAGGYFVVGGLEKIVRMLVMQRRHYIMALERSSFLKRGAGYTNKATLIRCVREDEYGSTITCYYLEDGTVNVGVVVRGIEFFIPAGILLKCFMEVSDKELYAQIASADLDDKDGDSGVRAHGHSTFVADRTEMLLRQAARAGLLTRSQCVGHIGSHFRSSMGLPEWYTDHEAGLLFLEDYMFVHLGNGEDKMNLLILMLQKLYALVHGDCCVDNGDALSSQEALLPGHFFMKVMRELLINWLEFFRTKVQRDIEKNPEGVDLTDAVSLKKITWKIFDVGKRVDNILKVGTFVPKSFRDLGQITGFTVMAERINYCRYLAHFRAIHRGAPFVEMRVTTVRRLLPESWGFLCPVHTPDGTPCGLLNHLTSSCLIATGHAEAIADANTAICAVLAGLGMVPAQPRTLKASVPKYLPVVVDGRLAGHVLTIVAPKVVQRLRAIKAATLALQQPAEGGPEGEILTHFESQIPPTLEIGHFPLEHGGNFPGIYLFTSTSRFMRPVRQLASSAVELIGSLEQLTMDIQCPDGGVGGSQGLEFTHAEIAPGNLLSVLASLTPFSDYNQSPRNMYQCQMLKQTMGTPCQDFHCRTDVKMYRLQTPQAPVARSQNYSNYVMDEYPNGTNAVVAVLAFTGYDMEDAMILNKASVDRGFAHGSVYKTEQLFLNEGGKSSNPAKLFGVARDAHPAMRPSDRPSGIFGERYPQNIPTDISNASVDALGVTPTPRHDGGEVIDTDGLPVPGAVVWPSRPYYSTLDVAAGKYKQVMLKGDETAVVDKVEVIGEGAAGASSANITLRINRQPVTGDKFASRAGQKGVLSLKWPDINFPFCGSSGMRPDLIINPHAFPSRMTIGMLVESLVAKTCCLKGEFADCSPFQKCDGVTEDPVNVFSQALEKAGFNRLGTETMINGITGEEMPCDIYIGVVYYQRLRHMVSDKFQVRSTGPINPLTRQPVKGRKAGGGVRLGEMERDSLLAHGAAYTLHDRLHTCSDYNVEHVCTRCGSMLGTYHQAQAGLRTGAEDGEVAAAFIGGGHADESRVYCSTCGGPGGIVKVAMPYVLRFLMTELAAMNIKMKLQVKP